MCQQQWPGTSTEDIELKDNIQDFLISSLYVTEKYILTQRIQVTFPNSVSWLIVTPKVLTPESTYSSVQSLSRVWLFVTPWTAARQASLSITNSQFTPTQVHWVGDATQPSHPLSSPSLPALNLSQHQGLFKWVSSSHQVAQSIGVSASASVLPMNTQDWSPLGWTGWISLQSKGLSRAFSNTTVQKHKLFGTQLSSQSNSHIHTWLLEKP